MQILGFLGMYFDAVVVEVKTFFTFIQIGSGHTVWLSDIYFPIFNAFLWIFKSFNYKKNS